MRINALHHTRSGRVNTSAITSDLATMRASSPQAHLTIFFPSGTYQLDSLIIPSRTTVLIDPSAHLTSLEEYLPLLQADDADLISIVGQGRLQHPSHTPRTTPTPLIQLRRCSRVHLEGLLLENSHNQSLYLEDCQHLFADRLSLLAHEDALHILGGHDLELNNLNINSFIHVIRITATAQHPLDKLTLRNTTVTGNHTDVIITANGGSLTNLRLHHFSFDDMSQFLFATALAGGRLDHLHFDECDFGNIRVQISPGERGSIGHVSFLSPRRLNNASLESISHLIARGGRTWLESAKLKNVALDEPSGI